MPSPSRRSISWLHLSDLHRCTDRDGPGAEVVLGRLVDDMAQLLEGDGPPVDFLCFTGDAAFGQIPGQPLDDQFMAAWDWLEACREVCRLEVDRVFVVPGNHDVDRAKAKPEFQAYLRKLAADYDSATINQLVQDGGSRWADYVARLDRYRAWLDACYPHLLQDDPRLVWARQFDLDGVVVGLGGFNSAWSCGEKDEKGKLWLGADAQMSSILARLADTDLRIALIHHPITWLVEAEDPGTLRSRIQSEFHVLLHGHEHAAWVERPQPDHLKIAAGAAHDRGGHAPFGYNLVRFDLEARRGAVWQRRWDARTGRWLGDDMGGRADAHGVWPVDSLPWSLDAEPNASSEPAPSEAREVAAAEPPPTAAERRGIFGRGADIARLQQGIERHRLVWLHGLSGVGKSTLVDQVILEMGRTHRKLRLLAGMELAEVYKLFAHELGSPDPEARLIGIGGRVSFEPMKRWGRSITRNTVLHVEGADAWLERAPTSDVSQIPELLAALVRYLPTTLALVVESTLDPKGFAPKDAKRIRLGGLDAGCLGSFFRCPLPEQKPEAGWVLDDDEQHVVARKVAGDRGRLQDLHPLALILLAQVADELKLRPPEVFEHHAEAFDERVADDLFRLLVERVLDGGERRLLRLLALYRDGVLVPTGHADLLAERVDAKAFGALVRRSVLDRRAEGFHLHSLLRRIAHGQLDLDSDQALDDHALIARAWLRGVHRGRNLDLHDIEANNEAFHHLEAAQLYRELAELQSEHLRRDVIPRLKEVERRLGARRRSKEQRVVLELLCHVEPDEARNFRFLGETIVRLEGAASDAALAAFRKALDRSPDFAHNWANLGRCLLERGEGARFVEEFEALAPRQRESLLRDQYIVAIHASALEATGRKADAESARAAAIATRTRDPAIYVEQAQYLLKEQRPKEALDVLRQARENGAENDFTLSIRGSVLEALNRGADAERERAAAIAEGSRDPVIYANQAKYLLEQGELDKALDVLRQARDADAEDAFTLSVRGAVLMRLNRGSDAERERSQAIAKGTTEPVVYVDQAKYLFDNGRYAAALDVLDLARDRGAETKFTLTLRGAVEQRLDAADAEE